MGGLPIVVLHAVLLAALLIGALLVLAAIAGRISWRSARAAGVGAVVFAGLAPYECGMLQSYQPFSSCSSVTGASWGFWATQDTLWWHEPMLTVQTVMLLAAVVGSSASTGLLLVVARRRAGTA